MNGCTRRVAGAVFGAVSLAFAMPGTPQTDQNDTPATLAAPPLVVPLTSDRGWQVLSYRGIPSHVVRFSTAGLSIQVRKSAAPLIYPFPSPLAVRSVRAHGRITGQLDVTPDRQGQAGFDDYALRLGLVELGSRRLGLLERRFAPAWVKKLFSLAPPGAGISRVQFFGVGISPGQLGQRRQHPLSDLLYERVVAVPDPDGRFAVYGQLDSAAEVTAIWISADGDDTGSTFTLTIESIEFEGPDPADIRCERDVTPSQTSALVTSHSSARDRVRVCRGRGRSSGDRARGLVSPRLTLAGRFRGRPSDRTSPSSRSRVRASGCLQS